MQILLSLLAFCVSSPAAFEGKSSATFHPAEGKQAASWITDNTDYHFTRTLVATPGKAGTTNEFRLYEIHKKEKVMADVDAEFPDMTVNAFDPTDNKKLWSLSGEFDDFRAHPDYFVGSTARGGDCNTVHQLISAKDGKRLATYSFRVGVTDLPVILRANAFSAGEFRFLAYRDAYWPCGEKPSWENAPKGTELAGVLTYATPEKVLQKLAVFYVKDDPSDDPSAIELSYGGAAKSFTQQSPSPYEFDYWWREKNPGLKPSDGAEKIFDGITVKLHYGKDVLSLPLDGDRLNAAKAKGGKRFKVVKEIPEKDWDKF